MKYPEDCVNTGETDLCDDFSDKRNRKGFYITRNGVTAKFSCVDGKISCNEPEKLKSMGLEGPTK